MKRRFAVVASLSALSIALGGCSSEGEGAHAEGEGEGTQPHAQTAAVFPGGEEGEEGEGEQAEEGEEGESEEGEGEGEGEGGIAGLDPSTNDAEFLYRLGLVRGHLAAFIALHRAGDHDAAQTHVKHPESEIYADLVPAMDARGQPGFAAELAALADAHANGGDVEAAYRAVNDAISAHEPAGSVADIVMSAYQLTSTASEEFAIGVGDDGAIVNAHEYQDAYGFLSVAKSMIASSTAKNESQQEALDVAADQIDIALGAFDGWSPDRVSANVSQLYGAAARVEIAALGLK